MLYLSLDFIEQESHIYSTECSSTLTNLNKVLVLAPLSIPVLKDFGAGELPSRANLKMDNLSTSLLLILKELGLLMKIKLMIPEYLHWPF